MNPFKKAGQTFSQLINTPLGMGEDVTAEEAEMYQQLAQEHTQLEGQRGEVEEYRGKSPWLFWRKG